MSKRLILTLCIIAGFLPKLQAQSTETAAAKYIEKYKAIAIQEQVRVGIPASITMAQALLESAFGGSMLATEGNNHFGIKCKSTWTGETILHDDDAMSECFRKYNNAQESYLDHSNHLKNNRRYSFLFDIPLNKYSEWATGLRKAGYATDPNYAKRLIDLIEKYKLQQYTDEGDKLTTIKIKDAVLQKTETEKTEELEKSKAILLKSEKKTKDSLEKVTRLENLKKAKEDRKKELELSKSIKKNIEKEKEVTESKQQETTKTEPKVNAIDDSEFILNGLKGFYANKGDMLLQEAVARDIRYAKLLQLNDLKDEPLPNDMFIYLEKKHKKSPFKKAHVVREGETMLSIAQVEGIQLSSIKELNLLEANEMVTVGTKLSLQEIIAKKPNLVLSKSINNPIMKGVPKTTIAKQEKSEDENIGDLIFDNSNKTTKKEKEQTKVIKGEKVKVVEPEMINLVNEPAVVINDNESKEVEEIKPILKKEQKITVDQKVVQADLSKFANEISEKNSAVPKDDNPGLIFNAPKVVKNLPPKVAATNTVVPKPKLETDTKTIVRVVNKAKPDLKKEVEKVVEKEVVAKPIEKTDSKVEKKVLPVLEFFEPVHPIVVATSIEKVIPQPKSPSTYKENGVSDELKRMKKIMDDVVYAPLPAKKIAAPQIVLNPSVQKNTVIVAPKPTVPKSTGAVKKDSVIKKVLDTKKIIPVIKKPTTINGVVPKVNAPTVKVPAAKTPIAPASKDKTPIVKDKKDAAKQAVSAVKTTIKPGTTKPVDAKSTAKPLAKPLVKEAVKKKVEAKKVETKKPVVKK
jgi:Mannosyl-glycoprotein endo-beta-N-acetylglucosaminidase